MSAPRSRIRGPTGLAEIRAFVAGAASTADLDQDAIGALAVGLARVLRTYDQLALQSFNLADHGTGMAEGFLAVRLVARTYFGPLERIGS